MVWKMNQNTRNNTVKSLVIGPGAVFTNFVDPSNPGQMLGATKGGTKINITQGFHVSEIDGTLGPVKGGRWLTEQLVTIETNLLEFTKENLQKVLVGLNDSAGELTQDGEIELSDYIPKVAVTGHITGSDTPVIFVAKEVVVTSDFDVDLGNGKDDVVLPVTMTGHYTELEPHNPPYQLLMPEATTGFDNSTAISGGTTSTTSTTSSGTLDSVSSDTPGGSYIGPIDITLTAVDSSGNTVSGATIYYTDDGTDPTTSSTVITYSGPITLSAGSGTTEIRAYADDGSVTTAVSSWTYTVS